jgi:hypothetical protein
VCAADPELFSLSNGIIVTDRATDQAEVEAKKAVLNMVRLHFPISICSQWWVAAVTDPISRKKASIEIEYSRDRVWDRISGRIRHLDKVPLSKDVVATPKGSERERCLYIRSLKELRMVVNLSKGERGIRQ